MDLNNLVTVEYNVTYNQTKLESVIKELASKIKQFDQSIIKINQKYLKVSQSQNNTKSLVDKLQQFTINNLRQTVNQLANMKNGLINYLGDEWVLDSQAQQNLSKSQLNNLFESRLSAFNQQTNKLSHKVSEIKQQLTKQTAHQHQQTQEVKNTINQQKKQISRIRQSIRQGINEKFNEFQKQFQDKNLKQIIQKTQHQGEKTIRNIEQQSQSKKNQLMNALKQLKRNSVNKRQDINVEGLLNNQGRQKRKGKFDKRNNRSTKSQFTHLPNIKKQKETNSNDIDQNNPNSYQNSLNSAQSPAVNQALIEQQSMQHAINALRDELKLMLESQMLEFRSGLQSLNCHHEKMDSSITLLINAGKEYKQSFTEIQSKFADFKNQLDNTKTAIHQSNQKQNQSLARIISQEQKSSKLQNQIMNLTNQFKAFVVQSEQTQSYFKSKDNQNLGSSNGIKYRNSLPNCMSSSSIRDQHILAQRLVILTQKVTKIEDKLKNGYQDSQKTLPRINSSSHLNTKSASNLPSMDLLRKDLLKSNEQLYKTNQRLETLKKNLIQLEEEHSLIPQKLQKLQLQIRNVNQIQQDRLLELIKQLINRVLTDPFNNHFTNTLKREIHVKFLQIKHEYSSIWKEIEAKVTDRAELAQLQKLKQNVENQNVEIKTLVNKKADNEDFKKGIKYLDGKLKQLYSYLKLKETEDNSPQGRKYYMGKKA